MGALGVCLVLPGWALATGRALGVVAGWATALALPATALGVVLALADRDGVGVGLGQDPEPSPPTSPVTSNAATPSWPPTGS